MPAAEARLWAGMVDTAMNPFATPEQRLGVQMHLAAGVLGDLGGYTRLPSPERPDLLPLSDTQLLELLRKGAQQSVRLTEGDKETIRAFGEWRYAVLLLETVNAMRVEVLLDVARTLEGAAVQYPAHASDLATLRSFLEAEWGVQADPIPGRWQAPAVAARAAQDSLSLPGYLRNPERCGWMARGERPARGGEPQRLAASAPAPRRSWHDEIDD